MTEPRPRSRDALAYLLITVASLCWTGNHVLGRAIAGKIPPIAVSTLRWVVPSLLLLPFALPHVRRDWPALRSHLGVIAFLAISGGAVFGAIQYVGLNYTTAINVSVLNSVGPVLIVAASALIFGDATSGRQILGILISLAGVVVIICKGDPGVLRSLSFNWGDVIIAINMAIFAIYSAVLRLRPKIHWLSFTFAMAAISGIVSLPAFALEHLSGRTLPLTTETFAALAYFTIFPSVVAIVTWNRGVDLIGPNRAGAMLHSIALYSAIFSSIFLGERLFAFHFAGFALIIAGVWLAVRRLD